jgi:hypothetical protein
VLALHLLAATRSKKGGHQKYEIGKAALSEWFGQ